MKAQQIFLNGLRMRNNVRFSKLIAEKREEMLCVEPWEDQSLCQSTQPLRNQKKMNGAQKNKER